MKTSVIDLFYDGACHLCYREVKHYHDLDTEKKLNLINIADPSFDPSKYNLDRKSVNKHMHARDQDGTTFVGVDAFIEIWRRIPKYRFLVKPAEKDIIKPILKIGYSVFAEVRPYLPKRSCDNGQCNIK
jgi:predicted DCC family thiol-disulfide oxidoreductase YuxK